MNSVLPPEAARHRARIVRLECFSGTFGLPFPDPHQSPRSPSLPVPNDFIPS
jgi:hypothetical protein